MDPWPRPPGRVVCLGLSALDHIWRVDALPAATGAVKTRALDYGTVGGGMAATAAVAVARLGGEALFWGRAGDDPAGRLMRDALAAEGVDVAGFRLFPEGRSSVSGVIVRGDGERQIVNFRGGGLPDDPSWLPLDAIAGASCVLADPRWPDGAAAVFAAARRHGLPTVLDADMADAAVFERLLPLTDHAIFSEPALAQFAGSGRGADRDAALDAVARFGCRVAAVTRGGDGAEWREAGAAHRCPAFAVDVVDTTGAGDVFHGAYALAVGAGGGTAGAMAFAAAAAALKCTRPGGRAGIPGFAETLAFLGRTG